MKMAAQRRIPPTIESYNGPKELWVADSELSAAREYFGYSLAMEALRLTLAPLNDNDDNLTSARQVPNSSDPEYIGQVSGYQKTTVSRLPSGTESLNASHQMPTNNPCP